LRTAFTKVNENFIEVYNTAQSSFAQANTISYVSEISYNQANTAISSSQAGFNQANTANVKAQAAFDRANTTAITIISLKSLVANSANYTAFQTAVASL
jgi:wobble nucleotide-excising tRNase